MTEALAVETSPAVAAGPSPEERLRALADRCLSETKNELSPAIAAFEDAVWEEWQLLKVLLGAETVTRACADYVRRCKLQRPAGIMGREGGKAPRRKPNGDGAPDPETVRRRINASALWQVFVGARPLALATRREVEEEARHTGHKARFLAAVLEVMPEEPTATVGDVLVYTRADELYAAAGAQ